MILGIDIGGTSVKFGLVSEKGTINSSKSYSTHDWVENEGMVEGLKSAVRNYLQNHPEIEGVGMGFPGLLTKDRRSIILLQNIPSLNGVPIMDILEKEFPGLKIKIENDSNCAASGEHSFGENKGLDNFLLITLGTGVGSGAMIDKHLFVGARGNGLEFGDMLTDGLQSLEKQIGITPLINYTLEQLKANPSDNSLLRADNISPKIIYEAALAGDKIAISVYKYVGTLLGQCLVSAIRILDITTILLGGGVAGAFEFIEPQIRSILEQHLHPYYIKELIIKKASLRNHAGLLGAAGLILHD
ncbi:MAG TPA: ROK family protein [Cytophagales bacterium]|nr:ROK family protein [Cytophagales bacterium]